MFWAKIACFKGQTDLCIKLHTETIDLLKKIGGSDVTALAFPFMQSCIADFWELGENALA